MFCLLAALALTANPGIPPIPSMPGPGTEPPQVKQSLPPAEQIRQELRRKIIPQVVACQDLIQVTGIQDESSQFKIDVAPTGKGTISGNPPTEPFAMLVWRCGLHALGPTINVSVKSMSVLETFDWPYTAPGDTGTGLAWVSDDPKTLDREVIIATEKQTWVRCEHKDAALTAHSGAKDLGRLLAIPDFKATVADADTDTSAFWKVIRTRNAKHEVSAHRAALPAFAAPLAQATGAKAACEPVRALGEKAEPLLTAKSKALAACLKHRHNDLWLTLTLSGGGAVTRADARATSGLDDKALDCLEKIAAKWSFPYKGEPGATLSAHLQAAPPGE